MNRSFLLKVCGIVVMSMGVWRLAWGVRHVNDPPMLDPHWYYGTSRQLTSIGGGAIGLLLGWMVHRWGRHE